MINITIYVTKEGAMRQLVVDSRDHKYYRDVIDIYKEAFPAAECFPVDDLAALVKEGKGTALAYEDRIDGEDRFVGAIYIVSDDENVMALFFAVSADVRGGGYGSRILAQLAAEYPDHKISLQIENTREPSDDMDNRVRREGFYLKNGYVYAPLATSEPGGVFDFMVHGGMVDMDEMQEFMARVIGRGLLRKWHVRLVPVLDERKKAGLDT